MRPRGAPVVAAPSGMPAENFPPAAYGTALAAVWCVPARGHGRHLATRRREKEQSAGPDARAPRARLAVGSHETPSSPASACSSAMRVSSTRDVMPSLRNTWRRWNATVCVLMNS
jgi:hypothetical protein